MVVAEEQLMSRELRNHAKLAGASLTLSSLVDLDACLILHIHAPQAIFSPCFSRGLELRFSGVVVNKDDTFMRRDSLSSLARPHFISPMFLCIR